MSIVTSEDTERSLWLVAQSNVAVKNIAEKLADVQLDFTLIVSKDFHYDWHEHLYGHVVDNVIRSDELVDDIVAMEKRILHSRVVLCTLAMLSNPRISPIVRLRPLQTLMVDEASQIEIGDYVPVLNKYSKSLEKMVFIGDDKQHRMPLQLGTFIGKHVYDGKLKTVHRVTKSCLRFVDVLDGAEAPKGHSWINDPEAKEVIEEARQCHERGRSYRVLTPYDAQRCLLETRLKAANIPWENKVFNVDSFQGNEDDYIIVSLVRTEKIGFLSDVRRVNVMLTRCRKGMSICTKRQFVEGPASSTLVGLLAEELGDEVWV
ncbi:AAA domain-containing protein [Roridomyces roridus]|uniref:AAA domain-containing protein n=1 Tax=Roridomyces roridus TaxID=1738132 RepID=A0AAD7CJ24_9AGAR|nr:AAA domain-containing protein [Roridomyces roridus]